MFCGPPPHVENVWSVGDQTSHFGVKWKVFTTETRRSVNALMRAVLAS